MLLSFLPIQVSLISSSTADLSPNKLDIEPVAVEVVVRPVRVVAGRLAVLLSLQGRVSRGRDRAQCSTHALSELSHGTLETERHSKLID